MARIKGKFVALVTINFDYVEEKINGILPFEECKKNVYENLRPSLEKMISDDFCDAETSSANVEQLHINFGRFEED